MEKSKETNIPRRKLLKLTGTGIVALAVTKLTKKAAAAKAVLKGKRYAMVVDLRRCYGCNTCAVACKSEFDVQLKGWRSWVKSFNKGKYPEVKRSFLPRLCNHCDDPPCVEACPVEPVKATYKSENGTVLQRYDLCIGCMLCAEACPYNSRYYMERKTGAVSHEDVADKCDFCLHRVKNGLEPSCVNSCPAKARTFGDLNDPDSEVAKLVSENAAKGLNLEWGTEPHIFYIGLEGEDAKKFENLDDPNTEWL